MQVRVKNYLRSSLIHEKMSNLSILCIESDLVKNMNWEELIHQFATMKSRKKIFKFRIILF
ncbi:zinc finger MYM-type protein 1-like [Aphis craccivora]|uniref:Zinc finger MYM-type protein 1-like n=1 Tax=Aphis craccivora TaxID=307492 RepID=A0A6G0VZF8_APHCR|nr:zinc finger MYM-type protein 1-like [Aphis craccivora]